MLTMSFLSDILGLIGVALIVGFYFMTQINVCLATDWGYLYANLFGAILIIISLFYHWNLSSVVIEAIWIGISLFGLVKKWKFSH